MRTPVLRHLTSPVLGASIMHSFIPRGWGCGALALLLNAGLAWADGDRSTLSPDRAVALALSAHPDIRNAELAVATTDAARSATAVLLSNPTANAWFSPDGRRAELGASQPFSFSGEGWHARAAARERGAAATASLQRARRVLAATVRQAYIDAVVTTGLVAVAQEGADLAARLRTGVLRKLEEGESSELDLRLARLAEVQAATRLLQARRNQADALRVLSALVLVPVNDGDLALDPLEAAPAVDPARAPRRTDLEAAELSLVAARLELRRARAATMPPVSLGVGVRAEDGETFVGPSVGLTFPFFDRNQEERARALGDVEVADARLQSLRARIDAEQSTAAARRREADAAACVEGAELQEARAALASIESGVLAGEIDLPTAVLLQTQVLQGEAAVVTLRGLVADARLDELLALDDDVLLGGAP